MHIFYTVGSQWLRSYYYLVASVNWLGAEQALCTAFHSLVCFSHRETFYYAEVAFSGEAIYRLYRKSNPSRERAYGWRSTAHWRLFPEMAACRRQLFVNVDFSSSATVLLAAVKTSGG